MSIKARLNLCLLLCAAPFAAVALRLTWLQVLQGRRLSTLANEEIERNVLSPQLRGRILDRNGQTLAESLPAWSCYADKIQLEDSYRASELLAKPLGMTPQELRARLRGRSKFVYLKKDLDLTAASAVAKLRILGIGLEQQERRAYPNGELTRNVLGAVGEDGGGLSGLEYAFDSDLRTAPVTLQFLRDGAGHIIFRGSSAPAQPPRHLVLTIDRDLQYLSETALAEAVKDAQARLGMIVVQDPATGELLAVANYPPDPLKDPAIQDAFEPGSTFKAVGALAAVQDHIVSPSQTFFCEEGAWKFAPRVTIHDHEKEGWLTLSQIMERSSNIGMSKVSQVLGAERFYRYARALGFGSRSDLPVPGEASGFLETPDHMRPVRLAEDSFGQGVSVSAIQLVTAYSAIAEGGVLRQPLLVRGIQDDDGQWVKEWKPSVIRRVADPDAAAQVRQMLENVVLVGTGKSAAVPGYSVAGKTGTAQKLDPGTHHYSKTLYTSSFIGFLPAENPRITLLVLLDEPKHGYYGADVAAPVFSRLARELMARMNVPPDRPGDLARLDASGAAAAPSLASR